MRTISTALAAVIAMTAPSNPRTGWPYLTVTGDLTAGERGKTYGKMPRSL